MTVATYRLKLSRVNALKLKVSTRIPANIVVQEFLTVARANGTYTFGVDYTVLTPGPISDPTTAFAALLDQTTGTYRYVSLSSLLTSGLDADIQAIAALTGTGVLVRTAANTWALRTITGTANEITVTNGDGVSGSPALSLPTALTFTGKTVTGGTFNGLQFTANNTGVGSASPFVTTGADPAYGWNFASGGADQKNWDAIAAATVLNFRAVNDANDSAVNWMTVNRGTGTAITSVAIPNLITVGTLGTGVWQATKIGLAYGGTNADLSATGGTSQYLKQASVGAAVTVGTIPASDIASGTALTKTDDTNVTLTLGGTPATALLKATSLTLGWTGTLAASRGGTGISSLGTGVATALGINVGSAGAFVTFNGALGTPSSGTLTSVTGLPISTGLTGAGTGVLTALGVNVGSAGAVVVNGGVLGTPSSGTLTNATGLPLSGLATQGAYTIVANATGSSAVPTAMDVAALTAKASPISADIVLIQDSAASNAFKKTTVGALASAGSVASLNGQIGALASPISPSIRLSLTSATAYPEADVTGVGTIYAVGWGGNWLPIYDGTNVVPRQFTTNTTIILDAGTHLAAEVRDVWAYWTGSVVAFGVGPSWAAGTAGSTTVRGTGASSTEVDFTTVPGLPTNKNSMVVRNNSVNSSSITANQAVLIGTIGIGTSAGTTSDSVAFRLLSNLYNATAKSMFVTESTASWTYSTNAFRQVNAAAANQIDTVQCISGRMLQADTFGNATHASATFNARVGIGISSTTVNSAAVSTTPSQASGLALTPTAAYRGYPGLGRRTIVMLENGLANSSGAGLVWAGSSVNASLTGWILG